MELAAIEMLPLAPEVPETMLSREPLESVSTDAVTPAPEELIAEASDDKVPPEGTLTVCALPLPT